MCDFKDHLSAGYPAIWVQTHEESRAIRSLSTMAADYHTFTWDIVNGLIEVATGKIINAKDPVRAINEVNNLPESSVIFMKDFHKFIKNLEVFRTFKNILWNLKSTDRHIVFVSPVVDIPVEVEKDITIYEFGLPTTDDIKSLAENIFKANGVDGEVDVNIVSAGKGLTLDEAENAITLSMVRRGGLSRQIIEHEKLQAVKKSGLMEIYPPVDESELGGLDVLKRYLHNRKRGFDSSVNVNASPKGIVLVGLPGGGKSLSAKVTASILGFPLIRLDISSLKGSLVGESEQKMRQATKVIDAISPCVVWIDEAEKALSGVQSSGKSDGGTTSGMFGHLLTWMQESESPKYIVATVNDIDDLLSTSQGAFIRRFDDVFFVDLPSRDDRIEILKIMNKRYGTDCKCDIVEKMDGWTGAEIEKFVVSSLYDGIDDAIGNVHPIYHQNRSKIESAREWAKTNARFAASVENDTTKEKKAIRRVR
jgi:hypothetical protein